MVEDVEHGEEDDALAAAFEEGGDVGAVVSPQEGAGVRGDRA
jgi:hypothetical protein